MLNKVKQNIIEFNNEESVNHKMISLARESRGMTQTELASLIDIPQGNLSRIELGYLGIKDEVLKKISKRLNYPMDFFYQKEEIYPPNIHFRKRQNVPQKILLQADALMNIYRFNAQHMLKSIELNISNVPIISDNYETPEKVASYLRSYWKIPRGAINDLTQVVEENGVMVIFIDFGTDDIDGRSVMTDSGHPIIFINKYSSGDRQRLTLAHELGHIIMHVNTLAMFGRDEEDEAFRFAVEFLMPYDEVHFEFKKKLTLEKLFDLKRIWKISIQAILNWASKNKLVTKNQSRYLWSQIINMGYKKKEPIEIQLEKPTLIARMIQMFLQELKYTQDDLCQIFKLNPDNFEAFYVKNTPPMKLVFSPKV